MLHSIKILITLLIITLFFYSCGEEESAVEPATHGKIEGKIQNSANSLAISGANVYSTPATSFVTTDAEGYYLIETVLPGEYKITCNKIGFDTLSINVSVTAGATTIADFSLSIFDSTGSQTIGSIEGIVYNSETLAPVSQINITTKPVTGSFVTDENGKYVIPNVKPGEFTIYAEKVGYLPAEISVSVEKTRITTANIFIVPEDSQLPETGWIEGMIFNSDSSTIIEGAVITTNPASHSIISGADGSYKLESLSPGEYTIKVSKPGFSDASAIVDVNAGVKTSADFVMMTAFGSIMGTVTDDSTGAVISGVNIQTSPASVSTTSDTEGNFQIRSMSPGKYEISASISGYETKTFDVEVFAGQTTEADVAMNKK